MFVFGYLVTLTAAATAVILLLPSDKNANSNPALWPWKQNKAQTRMDYFYSKTNLKTNIYEYIQKYN
jgi:hypothetical protein